MLGTVLGLPGYAAIAIAFGFTGLGVFIDLNRINGLGTIFKGCYFAGCVLAVCWVKRRALFGPMVQPPLLLAVAVPGVVLLSGGSGAAGSGGLADRALSIGAPLLNGFPTMAVATAFALAIGIARYVMQRPVRLPPPPARPTRPLVDELDGDDRPRRPPARPRERTRPTDRPEGRPRDDRMPEARATERVDRGPDPRATERRPNRHPDQRPPRGRTRPDRDGAPEPPPRTARPPRTDRPPPPAEWRSRTDPPARAERPPRTDRRGALGDRPGTGERRPGGSRPGREPRDTP